MTLIIQGKDRVLNKFLNLHIIITRPCVVGAVLQAPPLQIKSVSQSVSQSVSSQAVRQSVSQSDMQFVIKLTRIKFQNNFLPKKTSKL